MPELTYADVDHLDWSSLIAETVPSFRRQLSVNLPIQPVHSPDHVHVSSAMTVIRRRVHPNMSIRDVRRWEEINHGEILLVQFALADPPFLPDYRLSRLSLVENDSLPIVRAEYFAYDINYAIEYFCTPISPTQNLLWIAATVANDGPKPADAHVRARAAFHREDDILDYHYMPFHWDASKWQGGEACSMKGDRLMRGDRAIGRIFAGDFAAQWEPTLDLANAKYDTQFSFGEPYVVRPPFKPQHLVDSLHFHTTLAAGESKSFSIAILVDDQDAANHQATLDHADLKTDRARSITHFRQAASLGKTELVFPTDDWDRAFKSLQTQIQQLLVEFPKTESLLPTQGGSSERHFVWVSEMEPMLAPMLRLGHAKSVRRAIEFVFSLQDGGCPPEGKLTSLSGAIGTTGPRWLSSTGSALAIASTYAMLARDPEFLGEYLPKMLRAADWILTEIRATRKLNPDGSRPLTHGLMPLGCATDGDVGYVFGFTDALTFYGLKKLARVLQSINHSRREELAAEVKQYQSDMADTAKRLRRADGFIPRWIPTSDADEVRYPKLDTVCSAAFLAYTDALDPAGSEFDPFVGYFEKHLADGLLCGRMDRDIAYMVFAEDVWQRIYLCRGEYKKAFAAARTALRGAMTPDTFLVSERISRTDPSYAPWQPNGSGNGRVIDMMIRSIYFEHPTSDRATLFAGVPWSWLKRNDTTALRNLRTDRGEISIEATMQADGRCRVLLEADHSAALPRQIILPPHLSATPASAGVRAIEPGKFIVEATDLRRLEFNVARGSD